MFLIGAAYSREVITHCWWAWRFQPPSCSPMCLSAHWPKVGVPVGFGGEPLPSRSPTGSIFLATAARSSRWRMRAASSDISGYGPRLVSLSFPPERVAKGPVGLALPCDLEEQATAVRVIMHLGQCEKTFDMLTTSA